MFSHGDRVTLGDPLLSLGDLILGEVCLVQISKSFTDLTRTELGVSHVSES